MMFAPSPPLCAPQLKGLLETEYRTLDCFRREQARRNAEAEKTKAARGSTDVAPAAPAAPVAIADAAH